MGGSTQGITGEMFTPGMSGELGFNEKQNTIGIYIGKIMNTMRQFRQKFTTTNKILVLCVNLANYAIKINN